ncbi:MAG: phenylacetate--CoA ligase family protein [Planctomycetes bacterium]|nr:phenylacetate--CoA ligase family protein [Planctomycetota bacterium]
MGNVHVRSIPGSVWPAIPRGDVSQLWAIYLELERTQWLSPEEILAGQLAQIRTLLAHCAEHVPYYRDSIRRGGIDPAAIRSLDDFRCLPILQRRTYQELYPAFIAEALPAGSTRTTTMRTSGTSGMPIEVPQTNLVNLFWFAFHLRDLVWCGVDLRGSIAVIRGLGGGADPQRALEGFKQPCWNVQIPQLIENGPAFVMDVHQDPRKQLAWLLRVQPDYLLSYPPNLEFLASLLAQSGQRLRRLKTILAIGETLTDEARAQIETAFGVPVKSTYSCVEAGYLASPCSDGHGLHVHGENVLIEILDDAGQPCRPGETGRVVLTTLLNFLTPFIRYEILDGAALGPERCSCGRGHLLLTHVLGKRRPQFHLPDGRRKDSGFLVRQLRKLGNYHQHQIIQHSVDHLTVRIIPKAEWRTENTAEIERWVRDYFEAPIRVEVEIVERLELTGAGKFRDVIVNVPGG